MPGPPSASRTPSRLPFQPSPESVTLGAPALATGSGAAEASRT